MNKVSILIYSYPSPHGIIIGWSSSKSFSISQSELCLLIDKFSRLSLEDDGISCCNGESCEHWVCHYGMVLPIGDGVVVPVGNGVGTTIDDGNHVVQQLCKSWKFWWYQKEFAW